MRTSLVFSMAFVSLAVAGCSSSHDDGAVSSESAEAVSASTTMLPPPADPTRHLYFSDPAYDWHSADAILSYRVFSAQAGTEFKVGAAALDASMNIDPTRAFGFKLSYLGRVNGALAWLPVPGIKSVDAANGVATLRFTPDRTRTYLMEVSAGFDGDPLTVRSDLECAGGDNTVCETARQPGESCHAHHQRCDQGLFCEFAEGVCGAADAQGTCTATSHVCPFIYAAVCGCDGVTYGNRCQAESASESVAYAGKCQ
jgi:hypothetical protein